MTVPYTFANAVGLVPASELDVNFDYVSNNVSTANTVVANAQPNITSVGTLTSLSTSGNVRGGNLLTAGTISATGTITTAGNLSLTGNIVDLGELWINTLSNGNINLNVNGTGNVNIPTGILSVTGNIQGGNLRTAGLISATANVTGGNLLTAGLISATANITGGNVLTGGLISVTANITGGNVLTGGLISATDTITGGNLLTAGLMSATSTITSAANITGGNVLTGGLISATANITGGNVLTGGLISATANITGGNLSGTNIEGTLTTASQTNITSVGTLDILSATGNIRTSGNVSAAGNVIAGNVRTSGLISATGNVTSGNILTVGLVSATGNVTSGNILTVGLVSATGNVTGNYFIGNGSQLTGITSSYDDGNVTTLLSNLGSNAISSTGNITTTANISSNYFIGNGSQLTGLGATYGNANVVANLAALGSNPVSTTGNITGGNILTGGLISATGNITGNYFIGNGSQLTGISSSVQSSIANGISNVEIATANGNVTIAANASSTWTFGTDSNLTTPGGMIINGNINTLGSQTALLQPTDDLPLSFIASGANGTVTSYWAEDVANLMSSNIAAIYTPLQGTQTVRIVTGTNGGNIAIYDFDKDGVFSTAQVSATGNITANYFSGNGSLLTGISASLPVANGTSNFDIATANGNVTITANAETYTFGTNSTLTLPGGSRLRPLGANLDIFAGTGAYVNLTTSDESSRMGVDNGGGYVTTAGGTWDFDTAGNLTAPGNISAVGTVTGNNISAVTAFQLPVYANTTTRDTAISSPIVGMLIVVGNTYQGYNGASWGNITLT